MQPFYSLQPYYSLHPITIYNDKITIYIPIIPKPTSSAYLRPSDAPTPAPGTRTRREPHHGRFDADVHRSTGARQGWWGTSMARMLFTGKIIGKIIGKLNGKIQEKSTLVIHHMSKMGTLAIENHWACLRNLC